MGQKINALKMIKKTIKHNLSKIDIIRYLNAKKEQLSVKDKFE